MFPFLLLIQYFYTNQWIYVRFLESYLLADFIVGVGHWLEDTYFDLTKFNYFKSIPLIGATLNKSAHDIIYANRDHHINPYNFGDSWNENIKSTLPFAFIGFCLNLGLNNILGWTIDLSIPFMWLLVLSANVVHRAQHMYIAAHNKRPSRPLFFTILMHVGVLQCREQHEAHHALNEKKDYLRCYCILTPYLNLLLDYSYFWFYLEKLIENVSGIPPRIWEQKAD